MDRKKIWAVVLVFPGLLSGSCQAVNDYNGYVSGLSPVVGGYAIVLARAGYTTFVGCGRSCGRTVSYMSLYDVYPFGDVMFSGSAIGGGSYGVTGMDRLDDSSQPDTIVQCGSVDEAMIPVENYVRQDIGTVVNAVYNGSSWVGASHAYVCVKTDTYH